MQGSREWQDKLESIQPIRTDLSEVGLVLFCFVFYEHCANRDFVGTMKPREAVSLDKRECRPWNLESQSEPGVAGNKASVCEARHIRVRNLSLNLG